MVKKEGKNREIPSGFAPLENFLSYATAKNECSYKQQSFSF